MTGSAVLAMTSSAGGYCAVNSLAASVGSQTLSAAASSHALDHDSNSSLASHSRTTSEADSLGSSASSAAAAPVARRSLSQPAPEAGATDSCSVFLYTQDAWEAVQLLPGDCAEAVCSRLCRRLKFKPVVELLFALRNAADNNYVPACRALTPRGQYEFRLRFKLPDHTKLKALDSNAFEYFYSQVRHDLVKMRYPGIDHEREKDKILGLAVVAMYLEMIVHGTSAEALCKDYKRFVPRKVQQFAKPKIRDTMMKVVRKDHSRFYVMETYLSQVNGFGPRYLQEEYDAKTDYQQADPDASAAASPSAASAAGPSLPLGATAAAAAASSSSSTASTFSAAASSDHADTSSLSPVLPPGGGNSMRELPFRGLFSRLHRSTRCALKVELVPEYRQEAVLVVRYEHTKQERAFPVRGLNVIMLKEGRKAHLEWSDRTQLKLEFATAAAAESLVSGLATYYRLMDHWTFDLCDSLPTPSLVRLSTLRIHGPIGFRASEDKLQAQDVGYYLVRQCDEAHDVFYLDMRVSAKEVRRFRLTQEDGPGSDWLLHRSRDSPPERFATPTDVARSLRPPGAAHATRISPSSQAGELATLLLCQKQSETRKVVRRGPELETADPRCINPSQLVLRRETCRTCEGSAVAEMWADWAIDHKTFVEVTLKLLKQDQMGANMTAFLNQAQKWCNLKSGDLLRIYGVTLSNPTAMVMERTRCTLAELLKRHRPQTRLLIDVAQSLARALSYMHSKNMVHSRIRCSTVQVVAWDEDKLVVRLGDPGIDNFSEAE